MKKVITVLGRLPNTLSSAPAAGRALTIVLLIASACPVYGMAFPGERWEERSSGSQGVDPAALQEAVHYFDRNAGGEGAAALIVVRNGYVIWKGPAADRRYTAYSITKTFTGTVLGLLIDDGRIRLGDFAASYMPLLAEYDPVYRTMRIKDLARMTSGYQSIYGETADPETYTVPGIHLFAPGTAFKYHDPAVHLLGYLLTMVAKEPIEEVFKRRIGESIGMKDWHWSDYGNRDGVRFNNPAGTPGDGQGGVSISAVELGRLGHLFLNRGRWAEHQLIHQSWVDLATTCQVPASLPAIDFDLAGRYGYLWWTNGPDRHGRRPWPAAPPGTYAASGASRNYCFVIPEWDMVIVRLDSTDPMKPDQEKKVWNRFFEVLGGGLFGHH